MKFTSAFAALALLVPVALADSVRYDTGYDNAGQSLATVACSDGPNGLLTKGFTTFGSLPSFPNIGAFAAVEGYDSANCGTCFEVDYNGTSLHVLAIDHAGEGANLSLEAMNTLTNGQAEHLGVVDATLKQVATDLCGL